LHSVKVQALGRPENYNDTLFQPIFHPHLLTCFSASR
jgi:hypothetical protein